MIIVKIQGGLGNQLFQYAYGVYLASEYKQPLKLDLSWYKNDIIRGTDTQRSFDLNYLIKNLEIATDEDVSRSVGNHRMQLLYRYSSKLGISLNRKYLLERKAFSFLQLNKGKIAFPLYVDGYWQNYRYSTALLQQNKLNIFENLNAFKHFQNYLPLVAMHVRRGDYINNQTHLTLGSDYYTKALDKINILEKNSYKLVVFSDDIEWCKNQSHFLATHQNVHFVSEGSHIDQFKMMAQCKHFILANSSFSWWAARLAINPAKVVICPRNWIQLSSFNSNHLFPQEWIII